MVFSVFIPILRCHSHVGLLLFGENHNRIIKRHAGEGRHPVLLAARTFLDTGLRRYDGNLFLLIIALLIISPTLPAQPITVTDDLGNQVSILKPAQRIIALSPHVVEQLFSLDVGDKIIATIKYADYPPQAKTIKRIGDAMSINFEEVMSLKPDLIVAWGNGTSHGLIDKLKKMNVPVFLSGSSSLSDIPSSIKRLGELTGSVMQADKLVTHFNKELQEFKKNALVIPKTKVFVQIWGSPLRTIGGGHIVDEVITRCGGENIYQDQQQLSPVVSVESLINRNPQMIVLNSKNDNLSGELSELIKPWMNIDAVKSKNFCRINFDMLLRPTMRVLDAIDVMCRCIANQN